MKRPSVFESEAGEVICAIVVSASALYFAVHIIAAWLRGSFEVYR